MAISLDHPGFPLRHPGFPLRHPGIPLRHPGFPLRHPGFPLRHPGIPLRRPGFPSGPGSGTICGVDPGEIFVSYSRRDTAYVKELVEHLRAAGLDVWMDHEIPTGERWDRTLQRKIDNCAAFILVMSPDADESAWVGEEIDRARAKGKPILPLLLAGEVFFGFSRLQYDDVTGGAMPGPEFVNRLRELTGAPAGAARPARGARPGRSSCCTQWMVIPTPSPRSPSRPAAACWPPVAGTGRSGSCRRRGTARSRC